MELLTNLSVIYIDHFGDDLSPVKAARVSTLSDTRTHDPARDLKLAKYLLEHGHTSPYEHAGATFRISAPLYVARQIMRHRTCSYNEVSRRYTDEEISFYLPRTLHSQHALRLQCSADTLIEKSAETLEMMRAHYEASEALYTELLARGVAREEARQVLPVSLMTQFYMTANLLNWLKFIAIRTDPHTQNDTRTIATALKLQLSTLFPQTMQIAEEVMFTPTK